MSYAILLKCPYIRAILQYLFKAQKQNDMLKFYANGKLLLSGEYFVLRGACALALPTLFGQSLAVSAAEASQRPVLHWQSHDELGQVWFSATFSLQYFNLLDTNHRDTALHLQQLLRAARQQNPHFLVTVDTNTNIRAVTTLDFPRTWGLGSSSTLVSMVAQWAGINPFILLAASFGGSGYDIAAAQIPQPFIFRRQEEAIAAPYVELISFTPPFEHQLYFVYLGKKQNSRHAIAHFEAQSPKRLADAVCWISKISWSMADCLSLQKFEQLIVEHESIVSEYLDFPRAKSMYFADFWGEIKSLGAWGGDFVVATSDRSPAETEAYFAQKGFQTILPYAHMVRYSAAQTILSDSKV